MTSQKHGLSAEYCSKWQQQIDVQILGFFGDKFCKENLHSVEAETWVSG